MFSELDYLVVGSGLFGTVVAERLASQSGKRVVVIDRRPETGGNCHSSLDPETGIEIHTYGSHIFHTSDQKVWEYINQFSSFTNYRHRVQTIHEGQTYPMPISLATINAFFRSCMSPEEAKNFIRSEIEKSGISHPSNLEEKAISLIGSSLYNAFIKGYTAKQWAQDPKNLPENIITRLPVRFNYNTEYFNDTWQGLPQDGYFSLFNKLVSHPNIEVLTDTDFKSIRHLIPDSCKIIYTGMIDELFDYQFGHLDWRSLRFEQESMLVQDFQGCPCMNYADEDVPWTRIHEFKHYNPERTEVFQSKRSIICREYPKPYSPGQKAYYPVDSERNRALYQQYAEEARKYPQFILGGRLGCYEYWDMDKTISKALALSKNLVIL